MAIYTLHYVLFSVTKIANLHLLLDEAQRVIRAPHIHSDATSHNATAQQLYNTSNPSYIIHRDDDHNSFLRTHLALLITAIVSFLVATLRTLESADRTRNHRQHLLRALALSVCLHAVYLYTINTLATSTIPDDVKLVIPTSTSTTHRNVMRYVHTIIASAMLAGIHYASAVINSLAEPMTVNLCLRSAKSMGAHYQFITQLMIGALSLAVTSISLFEIAMATDHLSSLHQDHLSFTNAVLTMGLVALGVELICLYLFTAANDETSASSDCPSGDIFTAASHRNKELGSDDRHDLNKAVSKLFVWPKWQLVLHESYNDADASSTTSSTRDFTKAIYSLHSDVLSISADCIKRSSTALGEVARAVDDDEWDSSSNSFNEPSDVHKSQSYPTKPLSVAAIKSLSIDSHTKLKARSRSNECKDGLDMFDRQKFSLYDDFGDTDRKLKAKNPSKKQQHTFVLSCPASSANITLSHANFDRDFGKRPGKFAALEIILSSDCVLAFKLVMLILIGAIQQAIQLCSLSDYMHYLIHLSPADFRLSLLSNTQPFLHQIEQHAPVVNQVLCTLWLEFICASYLAQSSARILCLQKVNSIVIYLGQRRALACILCLCLTFPLQFLLNYQLVNGKLLTDVLKDFRLSLVLGQLVVIYLQVGFASAIMDYLINDMTMQYSQASGRSHQCVVHGLFSGLHNQIGLAVACIVIIVMRSCHILQ